MLVGVLEPLVEGDGAAVVGVHRLEVLLALLEPLGVVGEHGAALGREAVPPRGGSGGLNQLVEGDGVNLAGAHHVTRLEVLKEEEVELPVLGGGLVRGPLDEVDELGLGDGASLAEVVLGEAVDLAHDVVGRPLDPLLEGDVALLHGVDSVELRGRTAASSTRASKLYLVTLPLSCLSAR